MTQKLAVIYIERNLNRDKNDSKTLVVILITDKKENCEAAKML